VSFLFLTLSSTCCRICLLPNFPLPFAVAQITVALLHTVPFFVAVFTRCPIFRCPFFWLPFFPLLFFRCLNYCYQIYCCHFFSYRWRIHLLPNFPLPNFSFAVSSVSLFRLHFAVALSTFYRHIYVHSTAMLPNNKWSH